MDGTARFIRRENVKHYRLLLDTVTDEAERQKILKLLAEEREKQRAAGDRLPYPASHRALKSAIAVSVIVDRGRVLAAF